MSHIEKSDLMAEKNLNFNEIADRKGTDCLKYDFAARRGMPEDVLPLLKEIGAVLQ